MVHQRLMNWPSNKSCESRVMLRLRTRRRSIHRDLSTAIVSSAQPPMLEDEALIFGTAVRAALLLFCTLRSLGSKVASKPTFSCAVATLTRIPLSHTSTRPSKTPNQLRRITYSIIATSRKRSTKIVAKIVSIAPISALPSK